MGIWADAKADWTRIDEEQKAKRSMKVAAKEANGEDRIANEAAAAHAAGRSVYVTMVHESTAFKLRNGRDIAEPAQVIEKIERAGWRLEHMTTTPHGDGRDILNDVMFTCMFRHVD